jgi:hypothetical protein
LQCSHEYEIKDQQEEINMITKITHNGITFDHPQIMRDGTIQLVIGDDYYEFTMQEILHETKKNKHPEDWEQHIEELFETLGSLSQDI